MSLLNKLPPLPWRYRSGSLSPSYGEIRDADDQILAAFPCANAHHRLVTNLFIAALEAAIAKAEGKQS